MNATYSSANQEDIARKMNIEHEINVSKNAEKINQFDIKEQFFQSCINALKREDVKQEFKNLMKPLVYMIVKEIYPYFCLSIVFSIALFLIMIGFILFFIRNYDFIRNIWGGGFKFGSTGRDLKGGESISPHKSTIKSK